MAKFLGFTKYERMAGPRRHTSSGLAKMARVVMIAAHVLPWLRLILHAIAAAASAMEHHHHLHPSSSSPLRSPHLITTPQPHLSILVVGDWGRHGRFNQSMVADQMGRFGEEVPLDAIISTGDNFYEKGLKGPTDPKFDHSYSHIYTAPSLQKPWYIVLGNHDYRGDALAQFDPTLASRDQRWHCERSFSLIFQLGSSGNSSSVQFFFIDTTPFVDEYWESGQYYDWRGVTPRETYLHNQMQDLSNALNDSKASWKIVVGHHPIRSVGVHGNTQELLSTVYPILKQYAVPLYINGHDHCLEHISDQDGGMQFLTSGGGSKAWAGVNPDPDDDGLQFYYDGQGFMAMSISPSKIEVTFVDALGNALYNHTFPSHSKETFVRHVDHFFYGR